MASDSPQAESEQLLGQIERLTEALRTLICMLEIIHGIEVDDGG